MRCAVLADIHANLAALEAVLDDIEKKGGVDETWCLGDIVG
jgi:predicted phosphodiesterase